MGIIRKPYTNWLCKQFIKMAKQDEKITYQQKGTHLEDAVRLIEQTILNSKPGLKESPFFNRNKKNICCRWGAARN